MLNNQIYLKTQLKSRVMNFAIQSPFHQRSKIKQIQFISIKQIKWLNTGERTGETRAYT